jgi:hypothetical protein
VANGSRVSRAGNGAAAGSTQIEMNGLAGIIAPSGSLHGVDPASYPDWASYAKTSAGTASEGMFLECEQEVNMQSGEQIDLWVTTPTVHRAVAALLTTLKRFPGTTQLKGGYSGLDLDSVSQGNTGANSSTLVYDKDMAESGVAYGVSTNRMFVYSNSDWEWMQEDGAVLSRVPNKDAYEAVLFAYKDIGTDGRNAHAKISGIS